MKTKLTLYLEKSIIEKLKSHAAKRGTSLSQFIETEFTKIESSEVEETVPEYFRKIQFDDDGPSSEDWKNDRARFLEDKHG